MASVDVVLCFSHQDTAYGNSLAEALFKRGVKVFNFVQDIPVGSPWLATIEDNIKSCSVVMPILTNSSAKSKWVNREIKLAKNLGKIILPLLLEGEV